MSIEFLSQDAQKRLFLGMIAWICFAGGDLVLAVASDRATSVTPIAGLFSLVAAWSLWEGWRKGKLWGILALASVATTGVMLGLIWDFVLSAFVISDPSLFSSLLAIAYFLIAGSAVGCVAHEWFEYGRNPIRSP